MRLLQSKVVQRQRQRSTFHWDSWWSNDMGAFGKGQFWKRTAVLRKRPSYLDIVATSGKLVTFIVDCTCTGSLLQWFPELTFDKTDPLWICDDDRICTALIECFDFCQVDDWVCCAVAEQMPFFPIITTYCLHELLRSIWKLSCWHFFSGGFGNGLLLNNYLVLWLRLLCAASLPISQSSFSVGKTKYEAAFA